MMNLTWMRMTIKTWNQKMKKWVESKNWVETKKWMKKKKWMKIKQNNMGYLYKIEN